MPRRANCWTRNGWEQGDSTIATPIVTAPVGEVSVRYDKALRSWQMMYLDETAEAIVLRLAPDPTGPWSAPIQLANLRRLPGPLRRIPEPRLAWTRPVLHHDPVQTLQRHDGCEIVPALVRSVLEFVFPPGVVVGVVGG